MPKDTHIINSLYIYEPTIQTVNIRIILELIDITELIADRQRRMINLHSLLGTVHYI